MAINRLGNEGGVVDRGKKGKREGREEGEGRREVGRERRKRGRD